MLLVIDVGNTHTVLGVYEGKRLKRHWRIETDKKTTAGRLGKSILRLFRRDPKSVKGVMISSVVPSLKSVLTRMTQRYFHQKPLFVGPRIKSPIKIKYYKKSEIGADRIVNAVGAYHKYKKALIVVDFGTATTFDYITAKGEYGGGAIAPGLGISNEALTGQTARLPRVTITKPRCLMGRSTIESMQSGLYFGYVGLVDGIVNRMKKKVKSRPLVIATGGLARLIFKESKTIQRVEPFLTLEGLRLLYSFNRPG